MYKVIIDPVAKQDLEDIFLYVAINDNYESANDLIDKLEETFIKLEKFPKRGHIPEELKGTGIKRYLEIHYKPYRILYEIDNEVIYVHGVIDGRRNVKEILYERLLRS